MSSLSVRHDMTAIIELFVIWSYSYFWCAVKYSPKYRWFGSTQLLVWPYVYEKREIWREGGREREREGERSEKREYGERE